MVKFENITMDYLMGLGKRRSLCTEARLVSPTEQ